MCKRLSFLISFVLVLALVNVASAQTPDDLELWVLYAFEDPSLEFQEDSGPRGIHIVNDGWRIGYYGGVSFDGPGYQSDGAYTPDYGEYVDDSMEYMPMLIAPRDAWPNGSADWTVDFMVNFGTEPWIDTPTDIYDHVEEDWWIWHHQTPFGPEGIFEFLEWQGGEIIDDLYNLSLNIYTLDYYGGTDDPIEVPVADEWHHYCISVNGSTVRQFFDGEMVFEDDVGSLPTEIPEDGELYIGSGGWAGYYQFPARIDNFRIWKGWTTTAPTEGVFVTKGAKNPRPADGATRVSPDDLLLIWDKDPCAAPASEDVYFSRIWADVNDGSALKSANQDANRWPVGVYLDDICDIQLGETYHWAIDEVVKPDMCDALGSVWSFTIIDVYAENPSPANDAEYVSPCLTLEWDPGYGAVTHDVYLDVSEAKVAGRVGDPCYEGGNTYYTPPALAFDTEYFWVVDEVNASDVCAPGPVWSLTVGPDPATGPDFRGDAGSFRVDWGFDANFVAAGKVYADIISTVPTDPDFEANCVDPPYDWLVDHTPAGGGSRSGIADNNDPVANEDTAGYRYIRLKHTDNATPSQNVIIRAALIWSGESSPSISLDRLIGWGPGLEPINGWDAWEATDPIKNSEEDPEPLFEFEMCDGWMYSVYEVEFEFTEEADNIHVSVSGSGFYLDSVVVDARCYTPPEAHIPTPTDGEEEVSSELCILSWRPGSDVAQDPNGGHDVYFGTSEANVTDANTSNQLGVYMGRQDANKYPDTDCLSPLVLGQTYYWRIDEVNDARMWPGTVWSFTMANYIVVDDFEIYTSDGDLQSEWSGDYTALETDVEAGLVHLGDKSMYVNYFLRNGSSYTRTFDPPKNFSERGVEALTLYFRGTAGNPIPDPTMSVGLKGTYGGAKTVLVAYDGDANDLAVEEWFEWNVRLQDFVDDTPALDLTQIKEITIDFPKTMTANGYVYVDDIRLYLPRCIPGKAPFDITGDCLTNYEDIQAMTDEWLDEDYSVYVIPEEPCDANLILWYTFDPCVAYGDMYDYSGNENHGIAVNEVNVHDGIVTLKNAMTIGGVRPADINAVEVGGDFNSFDVFSSSYSVMIAFRVDESQPDLDMVLLATDFAGSECQTNITFYIGYEVFAYPFGVAVYGLASDHACIDGVGKDAPQLVDGDWHRMVFTYDAETGYHGAFTDVYDPNVIPIWGDDVYFDNDLDTPHDWRTLIGATLYTGYLYDEEGIEVFSGDVNEVRIYDYALTPAQIQAIAAVPPVPLDEAVLVDPQINLYPDGDPAVVDGDIINFKDYAVLIDHWLEEIIWPFD